MHALSREKYNPHPGIKLLVTIFLGMSIMTQFHQNNQIYIVAIFSILYILLGKVKAGITTFLFFVILLFFPSVEVIDKLPMVAKIFLSIIVMIKMFYIPVISLRFFLVTSEVGNIISVMDKVKVPQAVSIPIAVMFRFFPAFQEERKNVQAAMKMRGVTPKNPAKYFEYVLVPMIVLSSNIADDIAKSAETKCIADPCPKERLREVKLQWIDLVFVLSISFVLLRGVLW